MERTSWLLGVVVPAALLLPREARAEDPSLRDCVLIIGLTVPLSAAVGGGFLIAMKVAGDNAKKVEDEVAAQKVPAPCLAYPDKCKDIDSNLETVDTAKVGAIVGFSVAGAMLAFGIPWIIDGAIDHRPSAASNLQIVPVIAPGTEGVLVGGRF